MAENLTNASDVTVMTNTSDVLVRLREGLSPEEVRRWTRVGMLAALAMLLGYLETFIPIPIPGVKLGLANIPILVALAGRDAKGGLCIAVIKVLAAGLLFGSPVMMAYSAVGTALAFAVMAPLARIESMHIVVVSIIGALLHEAGQLVVAMAILGTPLVWYSAPLLAIAGCITGALCGFVAARTIRLLDEAESGLGGTLPVGAAPAATRGATTFDFNRASRARVHVNAKAALVAFIVYAIATLRFSSAPALIAMLAIAVAACIAGRVGPRSLLLALRPVIAILVITFVAQVWSAQQGTVLLELGPVVLTYEAVAETGRMVARLLALTGASIAFMHLVGLDELIDATAWLLHPLTRLGVRTGGFVLALEVAIQTVPALATSARAQMEELGKKSLATRGFWRTTVPAFIASLYRV